MNENFWQVMKFMTSIRHLYGLCHFVLIKTVHIIKIEASSRASKMLTCLFEFVD